MELITQNIEEDLNSYKSFNNLVEMEKQTKLLENLGIDNGSNSVSSISTTIPESKKFCKCGCGKELVEKEYWEKNHDFPEFILGHNNRNKHIWKNKKHPLLGTSLSKKHKLKLSQIKKRLFKEGKIIPTWLGKKLNFDVWNKNYGDYIKGEKNPNWQGGKSFEPYGLEFNNYLKEQIRQRDNYRCQQCFRHQDELRTKTNRKYKLSIHHIDFDKKNNNPNNLISLCKSCHTQTSFNREEWTKYFQNKIMEVNKNGETNHTN